MAAESAHAELTEISRDWASAIVSNDPARIAHFMTEDWVIVAESGISTREEFLALISSGDLTHSAMDTVDEPRIRVYGDTAVVTARATNTAHYRGDRFDSDEWVTDVFLRRDGEWRCVLTHLTTAKG
ncbi:nuclear transport factor 2 family protein [Nocardia uniformis]|uniref:Nuclear transport factor 2 family protein n=1 Tax=Nocardia uniformis TaxID=53432 RepID=A0A849CBU3_9NOCA|nr:nuclear transport factor 2 family protein [Nocardia uniformis]NNH75188.1 nuclear transport factor 2 family protein [Nocardia uniformis]